jgi:N4-gp56 family major capsid protein
MAATDFGQLTDAQKRVWSGDLWKQFRDDSFFMSNGFVGNSQSDMNRPVYRVTQLTETERGTECVMQLVNDMQSDGVAGDNLLEGQEEALVNDAQIIKVDMLRNGLKSKGSMAEQATVIRFRQQAKDKLGFWLPDKMDELMFLTTSGRAYSLKTDGSARGTSQLTQLKFASDVVAPSANRITYGGTASSEATLTTSDTMKWDTIVKAKAKAARAGVRPIRQGGKDYYIIVMSTEQRRDLLLDTTYQTIASRAAERGVKENPLFNNAMITIDGAVLYEHRKVFNTLGLASSSKWGASGTVDGAQALLMGAQAIGFATIDPNGVWGESDRTDYGNRPGIGYGRKFGLLKPQFKPLASSTSREDYAVISVKTAAAA